MAFIEFGEGNGNGNRKNYPQSKFKKGKRTCPVCKKTSDWDCNVTEDEGLVYCKFVPNESGRQDSFGRYEHILRTDSKSKSEVPTQTAVDNVVEAAKADADRLHAVYSALLDSLGLQEKHSDDLLHRRKLGDNDIARNLYASVPDYEERHKIASNLSKQFDLEGVPGFYLGENGWCLNMTFSGFYIPYRDEQGRIVGLQIRRDKYTEQKNKYMWVSSSNKEKGASSGSPMHFVNPDIVRKSKVVFLTEGALKADIIGSHGEIGVVASAGVCAVNPAKLLDSVFQVFPDLEKVVVAYDMDWETNENVRLALDNLLDALKERNVSVVVATWDFALGKGLDDVLVNDNTPADAIKYIPAQEFQVMLASYSIKDENKVEANEVPDEVLVVEPSKAEHQQEDFEDVEFELNPIEVTQEYNFDENEIMHSWGELDAAEFEDVERVIYGLMRGNVGLMVASTNLGKTTLALNLALSATGRREFYPLLNQSHTVRRILYIDGEATMPELQTDIRKMSEIFTPQQTESTKKNLFLICDAELDYEPLDLVKPEHQRVIKQKALACRPDLIIVDTLSALMDIEDENDNAKVKKEVMKPLRKLAKQTNSAILLLHHTGKFNEGFSPTGAYKGRGASAFGALSRTVWTLEKPKSMKNRVVLSSPKAKGDKFENTVLELDQNSRWFRVVDNTSETSLEKHNGYEQVIKFVIMAQRNVKKKEIVLAHNGENGKPYTAPH